MGTDRGIRALRRLACHQQLSTTASVPGSTRSEPAEEIPRLFRDYPLDLENAVMTIKVPRVIDRRDANPAMDLYDILLSLGPEKVTVLTRSGREYSYRDLAYSQVQGITESTDILDGRLMLAAEDGDVEVAFNASSAEIIAHLVKLLRARYVTGDRRFQRPRGHRGDAGPRAAGLETDLVELPQTGWPRRARAAPWSCRSGTA